MATFEEANITAAWDEFSESGFRYASNDGQIHEYGEANTEREERLPIRQDLLKQFMDQEIGLEAFKSEMASEAGRHKLWGYSGASGGMFFNLLTDAADSSLKPDLATLLRDVLGAPADKEAAAEKIERLEQRVKDLHAEIEDVQSAPQPGYIPYFASYFWQLQGPDTYPIYYKSMRDALADLELWEPSGDHAADYVNFWDLNEEIRAVLEEHVDEEVHLWKIERLCLFWQSRDDILQESDDGPGEILVNPESRRPPKAWQVAPDGNLELWRTWADRGVMAIGWAQLGSFEGLTKEEIADGLDTDTSSNDVTTIHYFANSIFPGDVVVSRHGRNKINGIGVVSSEYYHDPDQAEKLFPDEYDDYQNFVDIEWVIDFVDEHGEPVARPEPLSMFAMPTVRGYGYFDELQRLLIEEHPNLAEDFKRVEARRSELSTQYWTRGEAAEEYDGIVTATDDILTRLDFEAGDGNWLGDHIIESVNPGVDGGAPTKRHRRPGHRSCWRADIRPRPFPLSGA